MWFDRLTQTKTKELPDHLETGRFQWLGKNSESLNGHSTIQEGELLVGDGSGCCHLHSSRGSFILPKKDSTTGIDLFNNAITTIGKQLEENNKLISPILPAAVVDSESHLLPIELQLEDILEKGHLHQISRNPRLDIRYDEEVTDVGRAKRLAKGALVHLASHSECWQRQTLSGIVPKKVKARFSEDDFNIYENVVYARLLDNLDLHLKNRINIIESLNDTLEQALEFYTDSAALHHKVREKICDLWGQTFDEEATSATLDLLAKTLKRLRDMHLCIRNLKQSNLYLLVSRYAQVGGALHRTNILNHDPHYRNLATLWDELTKHQQKSVHSAVECFKDGLQAMEYYSRFIGLLLLQALQPYLEDQRKNRFDPNELSFDWAGRNLTAKREGFDWKIISLDKKGEPELLLNLVPWLNFTDFPDVMTSMGDAFIVWPALDNLSSINPASNNGSIAASPMDLYCVERFGWLIDSKLNELLVKGYAKPIDRIPKAPVDWIQLQNSGNSIELSDSKYPSLRVLEDLDGDYLINLEHKLETSNAIEQRQAVRMRVMEIRALQVCPVCAVGSNRLINQGINGFRVECFSCKTNQYLKVVDNGLDYDIKISGFSVGKSFMSYGRWF